MGQDKSQLIHACGHSWIDGAIDEMSLATGDVVIVGRQSSPATRKPIACLSDWIEDAGPLAGIASALHHAQQHGYTHCLCAPIDMPKLQPLHFQQLIGARSDTQIIVAMERTSRQWHPLFHIAPASLAPSAIEALHERSRSVLGWIERQPHQTLAIDDRWLINVNTPSDYRAWQDETL
jgi:molybdenum cofactor guanylyltransferase